MEIVMSRRAERILLVSMISVFFGFIVFTVHINDVQQTSCSEKWPGSKRYGSLVEPRCVLVKHEEKIMGVP